MGDLAMFKEASPQKRHKSEPSDARPAPTPPSGVKRRRTSRRGVVPKMEDGDGADMPGEYGVVAVADPE